MINVTSICAKHCWQNWSVYAAAKTAAVSFSKSLYTEMQPFGVRVTCLVPASSSAGFTKAARTGDVEYLLQLEEFSSSALFVDNLPTHVVIEEMTVWGIGRVVTPLYPYQQP